MPSRDRLQELREAAAYRSDRKKKKSKNEGEGQEEIQIFLERMEDVSERCDRLEKNVKELEGVQARVLMATRAEEQDARRMEDLRADNNRLAKEIRRVLKKEKEGKAGSKVRTAQLEAQSKRFLEAWTEYNVGQTRYHDAVRRQLAQRCRIAGVDLSAEEIEDRLDRGDTTVFSQGILGQERLVRRQLAELEDRHGDFVKLERSLREVQEIFVEVAELVAEQGETVDSVELQIHGGPLKVKRYIGFLSLIFSMKNYCLFKLILETVHLQSK